MCNERNSNEIKAIDINFATFFLTTLKISRITPDETISYENQTFVIIRKSYYRINF